VQKTLGAGSEKYVGAGIAGFFGELSHFPRGLRPLPKVAVLVAVVRAEAGARPFTINETGS
jgi:hypothetical protein